MLPFFTTLPDSTFLALARILPFSGTHQDFTFPALARILPLPVLAWIPPFLHSPRLYPFRYLPGFHILGTHPDSTLSRYSPGPFYDTRPNSTFLVLARISTFLALARISTFPTLTWILHFPALAWILPFSDTHPNSTFPALA